MKKVVLVLILLMPVLSLNHEAGAHELATDNQISATLHVDPDDNPLPGQPAHLYFIISDDSGRFHLSDCQCNLTISREGQEVYYAPLLAPDGSRPTIYDASVAFTFPTNGQYLLTVDGQPTGRQFQAFNLAWRFSVHQPSVAAASGVATTASTFGILIVLFLIIGAIIYLWG